MLDQIVGERANQPNCEHFGHKGPFKPRSLCNVAPISNAKLAIAINRSGAHQIADLMDHPHRQSTASTQGADNFLKQADRFIGTRQAQIFLCEPARLLQRGLARQTGNLRSIRHAIVKYKGSIPCLSNHPVSAHIRVKRLGDGKQRVAVPAQRHRVNRRAIAIAINLPMRSAYLAAIRNQTAGQCTQK